MFLTVLHNLDRLLSLNPTWLMFALVACEVVLLLTPNSLLSAMAFLGQRSALASLLWSTHRWPLSVAMLLASFGVVLIQTVTVFLQWRRRSSQEIGTEGRDWMPVELPLRASAAALGILVAHGLVETCLSATLPATAAYAVGYLATGGLFALILAGSTLQAALGLLMLADAYRVVYALGRPDPLVWGLWLATDLAVALAASGLYVLRARYVGRAKQEDEEIREIV
jgi:hypothetical protein